MSAADHQNDRMIHDDELNRMWKDSIMTYLKILSWLHLEGLRKIMEKSGNIVCVPAEI
jgi:hypothetical protein